MNHQKWQSDYWRQWLRINTLENPSQFFIISSLLIHFSILLQIKLLTVFYIFTYPLYHFSTSTHLIIISQYLNTSFTSYCKSQFQDINNMDKIKRDQSQVLAFTGPTNSQDLLVDLCAMRIEIMSMYQEMRGIPCVSTIPASINNHLISVALLTVLSILAIGLNCYTIWVEGFNL